MEKNGFISPYPLQIFVFGNNQTLGLEVAKLLNIEPSPHKTKSFSDGERICHQDVTVRDGDVFIIFTSQNGDNMDSNLIDYLRFVRAVREGQPHKVTVILPKLPHQRQDVENRKLREPVLANLFPELFMTAGADRIAVCRLHNPATKTRTPPMENIETDLLIIGTIKKMFSDLSHVAIAAADIGFAKNARQIAKELGGLPTFIVEKDRDKVTNLSKPMLVYTSEKISANITTVIFVDDIISTANTLGKAADAISSDYPHIKNYIGVATHYDSIEPETHKGSQVSTLENIINSRFTSIWVTDTVPVHPSVIEKMKEAGKEFFVFSIAKLIAQVIDNLHNGKSVSSLWTGNGNDSV